MCYFLFSGLPTDRRQRLGLQQGDVRRVRPRLRGHHHHLARQHPDGRRRHHPGGRNDVDGGPGQDGGSLAKVRGTGVGLELAVNHRRQLARIAIHDERRMDPLPHELMGLDPGVERKGEKKRRKKKRRGLGPGRRLRSTGRRETLNTMRFPCRPRGGDHAISWRLTLAPSASLVPWVGWSQGAKQDGCHHLGHRRHRVHRDPARQGVRRGPHHHFDERGREHRLRKVARRGPGVRL